MSTDRMLRINELIRREIGEAIFHISNEPGLDLAAITINHVITSRSLRNARVFVSILGHVNERKSMLAILRRHRGEIQAKINTNLALKFTPCLTFELDTSIERGDHVLSVLSDIEKELNISEGQATTEPAEPEK